MIPPRDRRVTLGVLAVCLSTAAGLPLAAQEPVFRERLRLPTGQDRFGYPQCVTADPHTGEVFVCDSRDNRVVIFDAEGLFLYEFMGGDVFRSPRDITVDPDGFLLLIATHQRRKSILELDFDGLFRRVVPLSNLPDDAMRPILVSLALSPAGDRIFVLDQANVKLWIADRDGAVLSSVDLAPGLEGDDRQEVMLRHVDVYGDRVLVAHPRAGRVLLFDLDGEAQGRVGDKGTTSCKLGSPTAAALDSAGDLVIVDQLRMFIVRWRRSPEKCLGDYYGFGDFEGFLYYPMDIALDSAGRIYVSQGYEARVQVYEGLLPAAGSRPPGQPPPE